MRCYLITCDLYRTKRRNLLTDRIREISIEWEHPHSSLWVVKTNLTAGQIRSAILPHLDFNDRIYVCEAGQDRAEFNALSAGGGSMMRIEDARPRSRMLEGIFSRNGRGSRHLKAATSRSLRST